MTDQTVIIIGMKQQKPVIYFPVENFINFMEIKAGTIATGVLYRSKSPIKGGDTRKVYGDMAVKARINCVVNLDDHSSVLEYVSKKVSWYYKLVVEKKAIALAMSFAIPGVASNEKKPKTALQFMIAHDGPYLIHCFAGVDRTGFVAAVLDAFMGASLKEICKNYLLAFPPDYSDSYRIEYYKKMKNLLNQLKEMAHGKIITGTNIQTAVEQYLLNDLCLSSEEVARLKGILKGSNYD
jgi:protein tyrosine/serine phosphatase